MLQDLVNLLEMIGNGLMLVFQYIGETILFFGRCVEYVVKAIGFTTGFADVIPLELGVIFIAMIVLSVTFLVLGRIK